MPLEPLLTTHEAASLLAISPKTVSRLAREGSLPGVKVGQHWRFHARHIDAVRRSRNPHAGAP
jgi:excisionase family DNA binding protein